jgi:hypothetical protein
MDWFARAYGDFRLRPPDEPGREVHAIANHSGQFLARRKAHPRIGRILDIDEHGVEARPDLEWRD